MPINYPPPQQSWSWDPAAMNPHHHHHQQQLFQVSDDGAREHMFEKPLTPSDVGKLNRLVIPKQHAEKYFPVFGESGEKGLLLSFEDEESSGKQWRFRYSYWTSSQSYVLTKGWSRFVKEKQLESGDVVLFHRRCSDRLLYIGSRRRGARLPVGVPGPATYAAPSASPSYENHSAKEILSTEKTSTGTKKRLRLFGVNLDCWAEE